MKKILILFTLWIISAVLWTLFMGQVFLPETGIFGIFGNDAFIISAFLSATIFPIALMFFICFLIYFILANRDLTKGIYSLRALSKNHTDTLISMSKAFIEFKNQASCDSFMNKLDFIYDNLLQHLICITEPLNIVPRKTNENPLWQLSGGLVDAVNKNPNIHEQIRKQIKWNESYASHIDSFLDVSQRLIEKLCEYDRDGLVSKAFNEGLMGQVIGVITQAKFLAQDMDIKTDEKLDNPEKAPKSVLSILGQTTDWDSDNLDDDEE